MGHFSDCETRRDCQGVQVTNPATSETGWIYGRNVGTPNRQFPQTNLSRRSGESGWAVWLLDSRRNVMLG